MDKNYIDLLLAALYTLGAAVGVGVVGNPEAFGYVLTDVATQLGGYDVAYHHLLSVAGLVGAYALNQPQFGRLSDTKKILIGVSVVLLGISISSPETLESLVAEDWMAFAVLGLQTGGYWGIAHS